MVDLNAEENSKAYFAARKCYPPIVGSRRSTDWHLSAAFWWYSLLHFADISIADVSSLFPAKECSRHDEERLILPNYLTCIIIVTGLHTAVHCLYTLESGRSMVQ